MRKTATAGWVAQPNDTNETIFNHWGNFTPVRAALNNEAGDQFMFGGVAFDELGEAKPFDGFESVDDARTFCVSVLDIPTERVSVIEG